MDKITFITDTDETVELFVLEETTVSEHKYLLVAEDAEGDSEAYIFREVASNEDEVAYEPVEDDVEFSAILKVFEELMEDTDFE
ncbi:MAG: DUF1292 domain-containing protein [Lachnospiraceae bacterium]|jgi:hypothetical protein|nr:DUF1292 domain-containing protein [Lachnospiraceae bacterium]MCR5669195.1 DUF1292 domain-containing protein [Lachnospiraceae bacterium]SEI57115.1 Protein of unknown function [Lachnospiraceae bacterium A10]